MSQYGSEVLTLFRGRESRVTKTYTKCVGLSMRLLVTYVKLSGIFWAGNCLILLQKYGLTKKFPLTQLAARAVSCKAFLGQAIGQSSGEKVIKQNDTPLLLKKYMASSTGHAFKKGRWMESHHPPLYVCDFSHAKPKTMLTHSGIPKRERNR